MDLNLLKYYIKKNDDSLVNLAEALNIKYNTLSMKLLGKYEFKQSEIQIIAKRYQLTADEITKIFF